MAWYALEEVGEALEETRDLLIPFDIAQLTKLAIIVLLTGSGFNLPTGGFDSPGANQGVEGINQDTLVPEARSQTDISEIQDFSGETNMATSYMVLAVIGLIFVFIGIPLMIVSSIFEFVLYKSLIDKEVKIVDYFSENIGRGLRYFGFRLLYTLLVLAVLAVLVLMGVKNLALFGALLVGVIPVLLVLMVFAGLTKSFILLRMMEENEGLLEAWVSFWPIMVAQWKQVILFLFVKFVLGVFVGAVSATVLIGFTVLLAIPLVLVAVILGLLAKVLVIIPLVLGVIIWLIGLIYLAIPFRVYLYYYVILVYHDLTS